MYFSLDVLRARKGDCLMLHFGSQDDPHLIVIDGGPSGVYGPQLKPRLIKVHSGRELDEKDPLPVDIVLVSHVDDDHIKGILDLTKEQLGANPDLSLDVTSLWHNSFDDLLKTTPDELVGSAEASVLASVDGANALDGIDAETKDEHQMIEVLASIVQGRTLRDDAKKLQWQLNHKFKGKLILAAKGGKPVKLDQGVVVTIAGPMQPELLALQQAHDEWLKEQKKGKKSTASDALAAYVDESVPNLSSIVMVIEAPAPDGKTRRMLLTGDARGDKILEGLELAGVLEGGKKHFDILKVPHHGSDNNMETGFFERLPADHYVFSGDGEHGNPERATLQMLLDGRGHDADYTIHLTYPIDEIDAEREKDWIKEQNKEIERNAKRKKAGKPEKEVRKDWSAAEHGLVAFFKANPAMAAKVVIVGDDTTHLIDLLDPLKL